MMLIAPWLSPDVPAVAARDSLRHTWVSYSRTLRNVVFSARPQEWLRTISPDRSFRCHKTGSHVTPIANVRRGMEYGHANIRLIALADGHQLIFTDRWHECAVSYGTFCQNPPRHITNNNIQGAALHLLLDTNSQRQRPLAARYYRRRG